MLTPEQAAGLRNRMDLTQPELAEILECHARTVQRQERIGSKVKRWYAWALFGVWMKKYSSIKK